MAIRIGEILSVVPKGASLLTPPTDPDENWTVDAWLAPGTLVMCLGLPKENGIFDMIPVVTPRGSGMIYISDLKRLLPRKAVKREAIADKREARRKRREEKK